ncbi:MAG: serine hydrolase domain-containing protein, partial [Bacteroidota bacterium]
MKLFQSKLIAYFSLSFFLTLTLDLSSTTTAQIREQGPVGIPEVQPLPSALPESVGMSSERLAYIDTLILNSVAQDHIPGAVVLIMREGYVVYEKAFGTANPTTREAYLTDHIFRIASQTKAITSTAVMMLWEQGRFRLDDPISKYLS